MLTQEEIDKVPAPRAPRAPPRCSAGAARPPCGPPPASAAGHAGRVRGRACQPGPRGCPPSRLTRARRVRALPGLVPHACGQRRQTAGTAGSGLRTDALAFCGRHGAGARAADLNAGAPPAWCAPSHSGCTRCAHLLLPARVCICSPACVRAQCREAFERFDKDGSGTIDAWELKETLKAMGQNPTDEEVFQMLSQVDDDGSGSIEFPEFLKVIEAQKEAASAQNDESDLIDAFVAMGGNPDKSGHVEAEKLRRTIKAFELTVDIDRLIDETDTDGSGEIDYEEFKAMFN